MFTSIADVQMIGNNNVVGINKKALESRALRWQAKDWEA